jgi:hypothetical protein
MSKRRRLVDLIDCQWWGAEPQMERFIPRGGPRDKIAPPTSSPEAARAVRLKVLQFQQHVRALVLELALGPQVAAALAAGAPFISVRVTATSPTAARLCSFAATVAALSET